MQQEKIWDADTAQRYDTPGHADWAGAEFTAEARSHVSVYRIPPAGG
ncbi:hypothetical protein [Streptomyces solaniscabiei]|nr:hypothetical protein [Streptomyces solaniscabiei]